MQFLINYGLFAVKLISVVIALLILFAGLIAIGTKNKVKKGKLSVKKINKRFAEYRSVLLDTLHDKKALKQLRKEQKSKSKAMTRKRLFVINFHGDIRAGAVDSLREEITALLLVAKPDDQVLVKLESGGGMVNAYGLAASQLQRLRQANLNLTISVDKVAASGGYMMACIANHVIAAPFAILGSIGVIAQLPNFHRLLKNKHIDFEQITAGEYKRTLTMFGENTEKGRLKMQEEINEIHALFKTFVAHHRPSLEISKVATGEHWFGEQALELNLVDELRTSDDYLLKASEDHDLFEIQYQMKKSLPQKLATQASTAWNRVFNAQQPRSGLYL